jgi:hypothetical protein
VVSGAYPRLWFDLSALAVNLNPPASYAGLVIANEVGRDSKLIAQMRALLKARWHNSVEENLKGDWLYLVCLE